VDLVALCSVVPARTAMLVDIVRRLTDTDPRVLTAASPHGLAIGYRRPRELGTDRLAAALGARRLYPERNAIVVDCGTATTLTALRSDGTLLGGAILPGLALWPEVLARRTAQLPQIPLRERPSHALGRTTRAALAAGIHFGHAGAVRELIRRVRAEAFGRSRAMVIGTGGHAAHLARENLFTVHVPDLILVGLREFACRRL
jgi:type III pantothenate kinase